jgi:hypothetical protein
LRPGQRIPRPDLEAQVLDGPEHAGPLLLCGLPGSGKTTLLQHAASTLRARGWAPVYLDLLGAASTPDRLARTVLDVLPEGARSPAADDLRALADLGKEHGAATAHALFDLLASLDEIEGRPVVLLLDDVTEIRSLAYFTGLRDVDQPFGAALSRRRRGTLVATSFPRAAQRMWPSWRSLNVRPFAADDLLPLQVSPRDAELVVRASLGIARYVRIVADALVGGQDVLAAWTEAMMPGGRLEQACRHTYEVLLLRSRGYGISKAVLATVAREEGLNLTTLVSRLGRSPGAVRDYLGWLLAVDALRVERKRYYFADGLVRLWVRLHGSGTVPSEQDVAAAARALLVGPEPAPPGPLAAEVTTAPAARHERLMEID